MSEETAEQLAIRVLTFRFGSKFAKELVDDLKALGVCIISIEHLRSMLVRAAATDLAKGQLAYILGMKKFDAVCDRYAMDIAFWCERELNKAKTSGSLETRPFVQNAQLIVDALKFYSENIGKVKQ